MSNLLAAIKVPAGELRCYRNPDPTYDGFSICLVPKGRDFEIDIAYVEVPNDSDSEYMEDRGMELGDIAAYLYGNVFDEDYTDKRIIKKRDIEAIE